MILCTVLVASVIDVAVRSLFDAEANERQIFFLKEKSIKFLISDVKIAVVSYVLFLM